ncbi:capsular polysaccharide export protein [Breoghania corrubedonensis]|uniref:Capsular polysaccharide export protein n=1 Tax=Breoghania corrubedonensis TaxID=665038 RepID=A0A2T5VB33_9HYPH|nr:capsular biosynthesis protein [Breoghania corrubedonensis]PTW60956.1 capsular polysaccharide export protein [Breoghania corrubedonensis]
METSRTFLFLQGPLSPLFSHIGDRLAEAGHRVLRVNLCVGDRLHWRRDGARDYRGSVAAWPSFIDTFMEREGVTDLILHGDRRIYHRMAADAARARGIGVIATELGYLRPDWMTIERDGTSTGSHFPDDPDTISRIADEVGAIDFTPRFRTSFWRVAAPDVAYNLANVAFWFLYPHYRRHTIYNPVIEYVAAGWRLARKERRDRPARALAEQLHKGRVPWFVLPMQLEGDFQLRDHSPFGGMEPALETVFRSFAAHAPNDCRLVVKAHPLDAGLERWHAVVPRLARDTGIADRVDHADGGGLDDLLAGSSGMVTVNSSAGLEALRAGVPVKALCPAIFDVPGMTDFQPLDAFWRTPTPPDPALVQAFVTALAGTVQARGTIHSREGLDAAVATMSARILEDRLNDHGAYIDPPPRLARARALGAPL